MPLTGVRVLDLGRLLPGPYAGMILAGLGAEVIKVEDLIAGDYLRSSSGSGMSAAFTSLNRGKRSLRLDLSTGRGRDLFLDLAASADVVVESFRPGVMDRLGVGFSVLQARNPRVVLCSITGYGQDGPDRGRAGHDLNYLARAGILDGADGGTRPVVPGAQMADLGGGGMGAVVAILAALRVVERTGAGLHCDVSMLDGMLSWMAPWLAAAGGDDAEKDTADMLTGVHPCYRVYRCADGWLSVAALEPRFWRHLCGVLGLDHLAADGYARGADAERVAGELEAVFATATREEWRRRLGDDDVCVEPVLRVDEVAADAQASARAQGVGGTQGWFPVRIGALARAPSGDAPRWGADSRRLLAEVGVDDTEFERLVTERVTA